MAKEQSMTQRAVIALSLTVGFYFLAIVIGLGAIAAPFIIAAITGKLFIKLVIVCIITGGAILLAILPRPDKFEPPGPLLTEAANPKLFGILSESARATGQVMPKSVYLLPQYNAWVAQRGGTGGVGGQRVMGIGLPLLGAMNISQFRAIVAHEFGHYYHGDTKLGPWIYKTRAAIARTLSELESRNSVLQAPFKWYGMMFLRVTHAISRNQEFVADRLAAQTVGKSAMVSALKKLAGHGQAYEAYFRQEFLPVVGAGFLPPLLEGYEMFLHSGEIQSKVSEIAKKELEEGKSGKYDTHPSLRERIDEIEKMEIDDLAIETSCATDLLGSVGEIESQLIRLMNESLFPKLKPIQWSAVVESVYIESWRELAKKHVAFLATISPRKLSEIAAAPDGYIAGFGSQEESGKTSGEARIHEFNAAIASGLIMSLLEHGWNVEAELGADVILRRGEREIKPFAILFALSKGEISRDEWNRLCDETGISGIALSGSLSAPS